MEAELIQKVIKESSKELFRRYGYHKTSVNEIAKKSRIAKATIYKYFESKELILNQIIMEHLYNSIHDLVEKFHPKISKEEKLTALILKTSRLSYTICNEFIGWEFIRENANSQEFLKHLSNELERLLIDIFRTLPDFGENYRDRIAFLVKSSKSIVFSFAFTSVTDSDVRKNFISFEKEILPYLIKATLD
jgi:AcrR family transcriptional regulator